MTPEEIKQKLDEKQISQADLARRFGVHHTTIHFLVNRKLKSDRLEKRLARILGVTLEQLRGETGKAA